MLIGSQNNFAGKGQTNPFYCAMVEELDYYLGKVFTYLNETDDPRWPGHKLVENTYLIFTSDNGGMEGHPGEIITDNYPLDKGKISAMEGGTRVPLIITGPDIPAGVQSDVMVNGLDFYPTILSWVGTKKRDDKILDGCNLAPLLRQNPTDASLVLNEDGTARDTMIWHFPNSVALESTIRIGDYKLVRNYAHVHLKDVPELELYRLYKTHPDPNWVAGVGARHERNPGGGTDSGASSADDIAQSAHSRSKDSGRLRYRISSLRPWTGARLQQD